MPALPQDNPFATPDQARITDIAPRSAAPRQQIVQESGDVSGGFSTTARISVGDSFAGTIGTTGDHDRIRVNLVAGVSYGVTVRGVGGEISGIDDPLLEIYNPAQVNVGYFDDNTGRFPAGMFTATMTGTHYLDVSAWFGETGDYVLTLTPAAATPAQLAGYIALVDWGEPAPLHFAEGTITYNVTGLNAAGKRLADWAFDLWSGMTGLSFARVTGAAMITLDDEDEGAFAGYDTRDAQTGEIATASVNVDKNWLVWDGATFDSYSLGTYLHEIGHVLGLGHAGPYNGSADFGTDNIFLTDCYQYSVMSYFGAGDNLWFDGTDGYAVTPMMADLLAIRLLYGELSAHEGNTVWGAHNNVGGVLGQVFAVLAGESAAPAGLLDYRTPMLMTISDTGGRDMLDLSFSDADQRIDLRPGRFSDMDGGHNNLAIATYSVIENAVSGSGSDRITGNGVGNNIRGGGGHDRISGLGGNDRLSGGTGRDRIWGDKGHDRLHGDGGNDRLWGGTGNDRLWGEAGADTLWGSKGDDRLIGGRGDDLLRGGAGADVFVFARHGAGAERDVIADWQDGIDHIAIDGLSGSAANRYSQLTIGDAAGGVDIALGSLTIHLEGVSAADIGASDFIWL
ncbi:MAG: M10 family metallopeptidase C-terminal domain-containing protein [Rubellimicrobium sp.]|nr:M10 family metallopeptidase C-terminal domain-containing protein [Rubellimicrobium sp.]